MINKLLVAAIVLVAMYISYTMYSEPGSQSEVNRPDLRVASVQVDEPDSSEIVPDIVAPDPCAMPGFVINTTFSEHIQADLPVILIDAPFEGMDSLYYFAEIVGAKKGDKITFKWRKNNSLASTESVTIGKSRWRIWAKSSPLPSTSDTVTVEIWNGPCQIHEQSAQVVPFDPENSRRDLHAASDFFGGYSRPDDYTWMYLHAHDGRDSPQYRFYEIDSRTSRAMATVRSTDVGDIPAEAVRPDVFTRAVNDNAVMPYARNYISEVVDRRNFYGDTILLEAIKSGSEISLENLLSLGANPYLRDRDGRSPLELAIEMDNEELVDQLIRHMFYGSSTAGSRWYSGERYSKVKVSANAVVRARRNLLGETPLLRAAASGNERAIVVLLELYRDEDGQWHQPSTSPYYVDFAARDPLEVARRFGHAGAEYLLKLGLDKSLPPWVFVRSIFADEVVDGAPSVCGQADRGKIYFVADLADIPGRTVTVRWIKDGNPPVTVQSDEYFSSQMLTRVVSELDTSRFDARQLLSATTFVDGKEIKGSTRSIRVSDGTTSAYSTACEYNNNIFPSVLGSWMPVSIWRDWVIQDFENYTGPSSRQLNEDLDAMLREQAHIGFDFLFENGFDIHTTLRYDTLMTRAVQENNLVMAMFMLSRGLDFRELERAERSESMLMNHAANNADMIRLLADFGHPVNAVLEDSRDPIWSAVRNCNEEAVRLLLDLGADIDSEQSGRLYREAENTARERARQCFSRDPAFQNFIESLPPPGTI